jgi:hypothetical protein
MKRHLAALIVGCACVLGTQTYAHHSFAATYLEDQSVTIRGELLQFLFRDPHSFVHVVVREADGTRVKYAVEWTGARQLVMTGITKETLKAGDFLVITGRPGREAADHRVRLLSIRRPKDGFGWSGRTGEF